MATLSEQYRSEELRQVRAKAGAGKQKKVRGAEHENVHAAKKATYAIEGEVNGRPSRKSTRKSANRSKPDANLNAREELQKTAPTARYRQSKARVRGKNPV